jgi:hypothetical protein
MSDKETLHFKIGLSGTSASKSPEFKILLNDKEYFHGTLTKSSNETEFFEFDSEVDEDSHSLTIELCNKTSSDTVRDDSGKIISDLLLNIDHIEIDEIDISNLRWNLSDYRPAYPEEYADGKELPESVKNCVNLGWNGRWILPFQSPFYIWLLENM